MTPLLTFCCALLVALLLLVVAVAILGASRTSLIERRLASLDDRVDEALDALPVTTELASAELVSAPASELLAERLRERYVVTLESGETFDGLLVDVDERTVVMQDTSALGREGQAVPVDGQVILQRASISYLQRP